jgi:transposase
VGAGHNSDLPTLMRDVCLAILEQIAVLKGWIDTKAAKIKELAAATPVSMRLQTMPGIGPLVAIPVETFAPDMAWFHNGRAFAAWLGLVPRQFSSGGRSGSGASPRPAKPTSGRC